MGLIKKNRKTNLKKNLLPMMGMGNNYRATANDQKFKRKYKENKDIIIYLKRKWV